MRRTSAAGEPDESLRRRHVLRTRNAIIQAALQAFAEQGFSATTIEDIADRADVASRTFFRYFPTKDAVLFHDSDGMLERVRSLLASRPATEQPPTSVLFACSAIADDLAADTPRMRLLARLAHEEPKLLGSQRIMMLQQFESAIVAALAERHGIDGSDMGLRATTAAMLSALGVAFECWIEAGATGPLAPALVESVAACRNAFAGHPAQRDSDD